jgi:c-di-GMP-binding flagellar brake protein YcgR
MPLVIAQKGKRNISGRIQELDPHSFIVRLDHGLLPPEEGSPVRVYFKNISGLFGFSSVVQKSKNNIVKLRHSEAIKRFQRRDFYRKKIRIPAYIKKTSSQERPIASTIIDLGGGGASLLNPDSRYKVGDSIYLTFFLTHDSKFELTARVVRSSNNAKYIHVEFLSIPEESRDRIIGLLYRSTV